MYREDFILMNGGSLTLESDICHFYTEQLPSCHGKDNLSCFFFSLSKTHWLISGETMCRGFYILFSLPSGNYCKRISVMSTSLTWTYFLASPLRVNHGDKCFWSHEDQLSFRTGAGEALHYAGVSSRILRAAVSTIRCFSASWNWDFHSGKRTLYNLQEILRDPKNCTLRTPGRERRMSQAFPGCETENFLWGKWGAAIWMPWLCHETRDIRTERKWPER